MFEGDLTLSWSSLQVHSSHTHKFKLNGNRRETLPRCFVPKKLIKFSCFSHTPFLFPKPNCTVSYPINNVFLFFHFHPLKRLTCQHHLLHLWSLSTFAYSHFHALKLQKYKNKSKSLKMFSFPILSSGTTKIKTVWLPSCTTPYWWLQLVLGWVGFVGDGNDAELVSLC